MYVRFETLVCPRNDGATYNSENGLIMDAKLYPYRQSLQAIQDVSNLNSNLLTIRFRQIVAVLVFERDVPYEGSRLVDSNLVWT